MNWVKEHWRWLVINSVALGLFGTFLQQAAAADFAGRALHFLTSNTGTVSIIFLLISLAMTPLQIIFGWRNGQPLKKSTGLWAFVFGLQHLLYYVLEKGSVTAIFGQFYLIVGLIPLLIMLPLAITSTHWWMRTLGQWWKPLHKTVYWAGITAGLHTALAGNPLLAGLMVLLLAVRIPAVRRWFANRGQKAVGTTSIRRPATTLHPVAN